MSLLSGLHGGHLTHDLYIRYNDGGLKLATPSDLSNIQFNYAWQNVKGLTNELDSTRYTPISITYETVDPNPDDNKNESGNKMGLLHTILDEEIVKTSEQAEDNIDIFLSLLKNDAGKYTKDGEYNPNGKDVVYKTIYGNEITVGDRFLNTSEMLFELLETTGLKWTMQWALYQYTGRDYGVTEFKFNVFEEAGWITV